MTKSELKIGMRVFHTNRCQFGTVYSLNTGDFTSCEVDFDQSDAYGTAEGDYGVNEISVSLLEKAKE